MEVSYDGGVHPVVMGMMVVACGIGLGAVTNRRFGHPTFHGTNKSFIDSNNSNSNESNSNRNSSSNSTSTSTTSSTSTSTSTSSRWRLPWSVRRKGEQRIEGPSDDGIGNGVSPTFADLPADAAVVEHIASFLHPCDLVGVAPVCRDLRKASESSRLWREHCVRTFGTAGACEDAGRKTQQQQQQQQQQRQKKHNVPFCSEGRRGTRREHEKENRCYHNNNHDASNGQQQQQQTQGTAAGERTRPCCCHQQRWLVSEYLATSSAWREAFFYTHSAHPRDLLQNAPPEACMVTIRGRVHDLTAFLHRHPGGAMILREHASTDATEAFERFFHSRAAREMAREFVVWDGVEAMGRLGTLWRVRYHY